MEKKKTSKGVKIFAVIAVAILAIVIIAVIFGNDETTSKEITSIEYPADKLLAYLNENINLREEMELQIEEFDKTNCRIKATIPQDMGNHADVVGTGVCMKVIEWLMENNYTIDLNNITPYCYVVSPYVGVTGKSDMLTVWGRAYYSPSQDTIKWEWEKAK